MRIEKGPCIVGFFVLLSVALEECHLPQYPAVYTFVGLIVCIYSWLLLLVVLKPSETCFLAPRYVEWKDKMSGSAGTVCLDGHLTATDPNKH